MSIQLTFQRLLAVLALVMAICTIGYAQPVNNHIGSVVFPTPNAASLGQYGDIPVSYSSGVPNVGVPIHTVHDGPLSAGISLSYHAGGQVVAQTSSWVGAGWSVQGGGMISRTVQGTEDEGPEGYLQVNDLINFSNETEIIDGQSVERECVEIDHPIVHNPLYDIAEGRVDAEPDIFSLSLPGMSLKFHFDANDSIVQVPRTDYRIFYDHDVAQRTQFWSISRFTVVAPDGTKYIFGTDTDGNRSIETTETNGNFFRAASSWYLERIVSADGLYNIDYRYREEKYGYFSPNFMGQVVGVRVQGYQLASIHTSFEKVEFVAGTTRDDLYSLANGSPLGHIPGPTAKALSHIKVTQGHICKRFNLKQSYYVDRTGNNKRPTFAGKDPISQLYPSNYRLKLDAVQEKSCDGSEEVPEYRFDYQLDENDSDYFPNRHSWAVDHWGYYNGVITNNINNYSGNIPYTRLKYYNQTDQTRYGIKGGADRDSDEAAMLLGSMTRITFPTGGYTDFSMEGNSYFEQGARLRFEELGSLRTSGQRSHNYLVGDFEATIFANSDIYYSFAFKQMPSFSPPRYPEGEAWVKVFRNGAHLETLSANTQDTLSYEATVEYSQTATYRFELYTTYAAADFSLFRANYQPYAEDITAGGLRVASITSSPTGGGTPVTKSYLYKDGLNINRSSGQLVRKPVYGSTMYYRIADACSPHDFEPNPLYNDFSWRPVTFFVSVPLTPLSSFEGQHILYDKVIEQIGEGQGFTEYNFRTETAEVLTGNAWDSENSIFPQPPVPAAVDAGSTERLNIYNSDQELVASQRNSLYDEQYTTSEGRYVKATRVPAEIGGQMVGSIFFFRYYSLRTKAHRIVEVTSMQDGVASTERYEFGSTTHLAPTAKITTNSDGTVQRTATLYSFDDSSPQSVHLRTRNILTPIEETVTVGGVPTEGVRYRYDDFDGFPRLGAVSLYRATENASGQWSGDWMEQTTIAGYQYGRPHLVQERGWAQQRLSWSEDGLLLSKSFLDFSESVEYYPGTRLPKLVTSVDGSKVYYNFDELGRLRRHSPRGRNGREWLTETTYDYVYKGQDAARPFNYVKTSVEFNDGTHNSYTEQREQTTYQFMDGLGRSLQTVLQGKSAIKNSQGEPYDQVTNAVSYDELGRAHLQYVPFTGASTDGQYTSPDGQHFTQTTYYHDPLSRKETVTPPEWLPTRYEYESNTTELRHPGNGVRYPAGSLTVSKVTDADGLIQRQFSDHWGRGILRGRYGANDELLTSTWTLHDRKDRVQTVYPPGATNNTPGLLYQYTYDAYDNIATKQVPDRPEEE